MAIRRVILALVVCICTLLPGNQEEPKPATQQERRRETGSPAIRNYAPKEYRGDSQNWSIVQDTRGIMYFGNNNGLLEYDGVSWRIIPMPNASAVRSLAVAGDGRIYVGAEAEFGYLTADSSGLLVYISLVEHLPGSGLQLAEIRKTLVTREGIYFQTPDHLLRWSGPGDPSVSAADTPPAASRAALATGSSGQIKIWEPTTSFYLSFVVENTLYLRQRGVGLMQMIEDSLQLVPGGERFANQAIHVMLPFSRNSHSATDQPILIGTLRDGLYLYDGKSVTPFTTGANDFLRTNQLYHGAVLGEGIYALGTLRGGVALINPEGELLQIINKNAGLRDDFILFVGSDDQDGLWLALNNGLSRIESPLTLAFYKENLGIGSDVYDIVRHSGQVFAATGLGVFGMESGEPAGDPPVFRAVPGIDVQSWSLLSSRNSLLAATSTGVYAINGKNARSILGDKVSYVLYPSKFYPDRIYLGLQDGLAALLWRRGKWQYDRQYPGISENVRSILEDKSGNLWLGTLNQGVIRIESSELAPRPEESAINVIHYGEENGLPAGWTGVYSIRDRIVFTTFKGLRYFDSGSGAFLTERGFGPHLADTTGRLEYLSSDDQGRIWTQLFTSGKSETGAAAPQDDGTYRWNPLPHLHNGRLIESIYTYLIDGANSGIVWFGGTGGIVRYDSGHPKNESRRFPVYIRRVVARNDLLLYGGVQLPAVQESSIKTEPPARELAYRHNSLRFAYATPSYDDSDGNQFQYYLEGFDDRWSDWSGEVQKDYTNLAAGSYRFRVRAKNSYEQISEEDSFRFLILPPWYQSWWAYLFYGLFASAFIAAVAVGFNRLRTRNLEWKNRELEQMVEIRTGEIRQQAELLREQKSEIADQRDRIQQAYESVELLSRIGRDITGNLSIAAIINTVYKNVNALMDAAVFGIGIYNKENDSIDFPATKEKGETLENYVNLLSDDSRPAVWCFKNEKEIMINDLDTEYHKYIKILKPPLSGEDPSSILYVPLINQKRAIGVITAQSFQKNAFSEYQLNILRNVATYTAIALDNADAYRKLKETLENLKTTQDQLVVQEKLALLGQLTAGIAHEIKNPLNFVNNFAESSVELARELQEELAGVQETVPPDEYEVIGELLTDLIQNMADINENGKRADSIVKSMMAHASGAKGEIQATDLNALIDESVNLAYHGMRARNSFFNITLQKDYDQTIGLVEMIPQDLSSVFLNILGNACFATLEKQQEIGESFSGTLAVSTKNLENLVEIRIRDNGKGIKKEHLQNIFNPFFTTKPTGVGTGLGLSISHDFIMKHKGSITVDSVRGEYTEFVIRMPKKQSGLL